MEETEIDLTQGLQRSQSLRWLAFLYIGSNCSTNDFKNCLFNTLGLPVMRVTASNKEAADDAVMIELKEWCDVHKPELSHLFELVQE